jgi:predicted Na+-dependent transporter
VTTLGLALVSSVPMTVFSIYHSFMIETLISKQFSDSIFYIIMVNVIFSLISYSLSLFVFKIVKNSQNDNRE